MIGMSTLLITAALFGALLSAITLYIAFQQSKGIKCLKEISRDMKTHMRQLHEEHKSIKEGIGSIKEDTASIKEVLQK